MEEDFDDLGYHRDHVTMLVASGFFNEDDLEEYLADLAFDPHAAGHATAIAEHARAAFAAKREAETGWPAVTDWDRLDSAFAALETEQVLALHNAGMTVSDAHSDAWDLIGRDAPGSWRGFAFYHEQDMERAIGGGTLSIGFDAVEQSTPARQAIGALVVSALRGAGFAPDWDGNPDMRITVPGIVWRKRTQWVRPALPPSAAANGTGFWHRFRGQ